ncbi:MAG: peptide ABC transporter substrate-binding protein [Planctomycetes bacterium]|nr:peptide ABC transporter substrate-binding protein [Planctomycetota bacterium]
MFARLMITCLVLTAGILLIVGQGSEAGRADFCYLNGAGINTLDPAQISWNQDIRLALNIWEGLTTYHPETTTPIEGVAEFPPDVTDDGLIYTFHLREDARWSDGSPVTAGDFVRGWRRAIEPGSAGDYAFFILDTIVGARDYYEWRQKKVARLTELWRNVSTTGTADAQRRHAESLRAHVEEMDRRFASVGLDAIDDRTLEVRLIRPCAYFLDLCAFVTLLPCHQSIARLRERYLDHPITAQGLVVYNHQWTKPDYHANDYPGLITNGPYRMTEWVFKRRARLEVNPYYWDAESITCRTIDMVVYDDLNTALLAYESGDLDFLPDMQVDYDHELVRLCKEGIRSDFYFPNVFGTYYYLFNCRDERFRGEINPFVDKRVRKAFSLAVDKQQLVDKVIGRGDPVSDHLIPPGSIPGYESPPGAAYDPDEARRLLAEAGYPGGNGIPVIEILYNTGYQHGKICEALSQMWERELGVRTALVGKEAKTFADDKVNHQFMVARAGWYGDYGDPTTFLDVFATDNGNNDAGFSNDRFDDLLVRAADIQDPGQRLTVLADAEALLIQDEFPAMPLYQYTNLLAIKPHVSGLYPNPRLMFPFRYLRVERWPSG